MELGELGLEVGEATHDQLAVLARDECDKLFAKQANVLREAKGVLESYVDEDGEGFPFTVQLFSALKRIGIEEADAKIQSLVGLDIEPELDETSEDAVDGASDAAPEDDHKAPDQS